MKPDGKIRTYKGLNMLYLVKTLVHYSRVRDMAWDPRKDILFLCQNYGEDVQAVRSQLDPKGIQQNFLGTNFFSRLSPEDQRRCYLVLLGKEPPPVMAITPPAAPQEGHRYSRSTSEQTRPRMSTHKSSPSLNAQTSPALLSPPLPGKPNSSTKSTERPGPQPVELSASPKPPSELPASSDSRSRYRPISAPHTRNNSSDNSRPVNQGRPQSMESRNLPIQTQGSFEHSQMRSTSGNLNIIPQAMPNLAPVPVFAQERRSMPNLNAAAGGQIVPNAFGQLPMMNGGMPFRPHPQQFQMAPVEMSATPAPYNPGQEHLKAQLGLGGDYLLPHMRGNERPITSNPKPPNARTGHTGPQHPKIERSGTPMLQSQAGSLHVVSPDGEPATFLQHAPNLEEVTKKLHLVGPEGLYPGHPKPKQSPQPAVFELDSTSQPHNIVAELSDNIDAAIAQSQPQELPCDSIQQRPYTSPSIEESPVSPPESRAIPAASNVQPLEPTRPLNPRAQSAPLGFLPASLMAGGAGPHFRPVSNDSSSAPQSAPADVSIPKTNASRYSRYYSPPSSTPASHHASPQLNHSPLTSMYKAYQPSALIQSPPEVHPEVQPAASDLNDRQSLPSFATLKELDDDQPRYRTHKRDASHDSHASSASHDSSRLAQEYQAELPNFEQGYASGSK